MLSNSCRYGIRAVVYIAIRYPAKTNIGIKEISGDLNLPAPYLAKILQLLARHKILNSVKGPNGGFSLQKRPESVTMLDIVKIIDGEALFENCLIHDGSCTEAKKKNRTCPVHDDFSKIREDIDKLFRGKTIQDLVNTAGASKNISI
ncbi:MAG TPA: Rrf2 family transcriptional regulator [Bacteroidales bacterium]|jgi:Rrf2 family transcriptional regulator, iron-sulfur cluster assembly transcription factor|nr:Rrf2 family transcriptional regulator [Bacteroidales bacterium]HBZ20884.1 Rrf2 family transcriptional regulator [Bacteroidales bacterium]